MDEQTTKLLKECNSGCKMAINSIDRLKDFVTNPELDKKLAEAKEQHRYLENETSKLLKEAGQEEKEPDRMAAAFSWITTEVKMMIKDDSSQVAKVLMNGCNMGIQSISECMNQCSNASHESKSLAKKLVKCEEQIMEDMKKFL